MYTPDVPKLPIAAFDVLYRCEGEPDLPHYPGSAWRGAFGHALKRTVCVVRDVACPDCLLYRTCAYPYLFETPPPPDAEKMRRYPAAPHPFVLHIDPRQPSGDYRLGLVLFGRAERQLPYFIRALEQAGQSGIGRRRQVFALAEVRQAKPVDPPAWQTVYGADQPLRADPAVVPAVPPLPARVAVRLETPLRLQRESRLVTPGMFRFGDLFGTLLRRLSMLTYFHTDTPLETDFAALNAAARTVAIESADLSWYDWTRYSSRQDTTVDMGGLLGRFELDGAALAPFWPYLWLGQWTHAGKGTSMGLGRYSLHPASLPEDP